MHWTRTPAASPTLLPYRYNIHHSPKDARTPASPNIKVATPNARTRFGEVDGVSIDYCDGTIAVGGPGDFWAVWRYDSGAWTLQFYTFSGSELCEILASDDPNNSFGGWC